MILEIWIAVTALVLALLAYWPSFQTSKLPPGPWFSFPILGHLPLLGDQPARTLLKWKDIYGPLISIRIGSFPAIVINEANLIKTAFNQSVFAGRPLIKYLDDCVMGRKGFMLSDGPHAQEQRQFMRRNLKDFGSGSRTMENIIIDQASQLLVKLQENEGKPYRVKHLFNGYTINTLWSIVTGDLLNPKDNKTTELAEAIARTAAFPRVIDKLMVFVPKLAVLFPSWSGYTEKINSMRQVGVFVDKQICTIKENRIKNQPRIVLDAYLDKVEETTDIRSSFHPENYPIQISTSTQNLFGAGVETSSTTLEWIFFHLSNNPEIKTKLQNEIDRVIGFGIGSSRLPSASDKPQMPYTEAVINEVLRFNTIAPLSLYHRTLEDVEFNGYEIPKDTMILANLHAVHNDPEVWGDPEVFRPERFLSKDGKILKIEEFMPFSTGKRNCIGENLARLQLFLFTVSIFQRFDIRSSGTLPSAEGNFGLTVCPDPFDVIIKSREEN